MNLPSLRHYTPDSLVLLLVLASPLLFPLSSEANPLKKAEEISLDTAQKAIASQNKIDTVHRDTEALLQQYREVTQEIDSLKTHNKQLQSLIASQEEERLSLKEQLENIDEANLKIMPLMEEMISMLENFVSLDIPFLPKERNTRIERLRQMMKQADISVSEKYRRVLEAYQIENDYARSIEAYRAKLPGEKEERVVDFLRIGRLALLYQTLDGSETGHFDKNASSWVVLPGKYRRVVKKGLAMARKQVAPELLSLPVVAPEVLK